MNLKEAFRYQNFLASMINNARGFLYQRDHALQTIMTHKKHAANQDEEDVIEVEDNGAIESNDDVIKFMLWAIEQREQLGLAISQAKRYALTDIDAEIGANKFRQSAAESIKQMLSFEPKSGKDTGRGYKFNNDGVQAPYMYTIEVAQKELFDREFAKHTVKELMKKSDEVSAQIDYTMINTEVEYTPVFNVNSSFHDVMAEFKEINT